MTSKLKCPFCQTELEYDWGYDGDYSCRKCGRNKMFGSEELWQALIQAKQDLEIAVDALNAIIATPLNSRVIHDTANKALEQIDHIADVSKMVEHKE